MTARATSIFVITMTVILSVIDFLLTKDSIPENTYSARIREWGIQYRWLPYLIAAFFGACLTHWFLKRDRDGKLSKRRKIVLFSGLLAAVFVGMILGLFW